MLDFSVQAYFNLSILHTASNIANPSTKEHLYASDCAPIATSQKDFQL